MSTVSLTQGPLLSNFKDSLMDLVLTVFPEIDEEDTIWRLHSMPDLTCWCIHEEDQMVAFKIGYAIQIRHYYSWLGGVHPEWTRRGFARQLMNCQHDWLIDNDYTHVDTCIRGHNTAMQKLNVTSGFVEVAKRIKSYGYELTFQKTLIEV